MILNKGQNQNLQRILKLLIYRKCHPENNLEVKKPHTKIKINLIILL